MKNEDVLFSIGLMITPKDGKTHLSHGFITSADLDLANKHGLTIEDVFNLKIEAGKKQIFDEIWKQED